MAPATVKAPSRIEFITFPVFALTWHASAPNTRYSCNVLAYCGGGGSAKTGVGNTVQIVITTPSEGQRVVAIDTGVEIGVSVALHQPFHSRDLEGSLWVLIAVGDEARLYSIPILCHDDDSDENNDSDENENNNDDKKGAKLLAKAHLGEKYGANTVAFNPMGNGIAVGCENGNVVIYNLLSEMANDVTTFQLEKYTDMQGHIKAVCAVKFHPRDGTVLMSSAKDGTCRVLNLRTQQPIDVLHCKIYDPNQRPPPTNANILNPKPGQLLVRGCAFGDLNGTLIYTVQSGRKGSAFLSSWKLLSTPNQTPPQQQHTNQPQQQTQQQPKLHFQEQFRKPISPFPVSAMSLSGDFSTMAIGDTNGTVTLLSTETFKPLKKWDTVHDLPVTCIAARPLPMELPGEQLTGVKVDAVSASADNRLTSLTLQRKSTLKPVNTRKSRQTNASSHSLISYLLAIFILFTLAFIFKVSYDICSGEITGTYSDLDAITECVFHTVLFAPSDRPGVSFVPH